MGVECLIKGARQVFRANKEVVLSGGAINSPQLLQLSGIGDGALLHKMGIAVQQHSPQVGQGLQDHLGASYFFRSRVRTLNNELYPLHGKLKAGLRYLLGKRGPLAMSVNQAGAFVRSRPELQRPDMQLYFNPISYSNDAIRPGKLREPDPFPAFLISFNSCRPTSRGSVSIRSSDPTDKPVINTNFLSTSQDIQDAIAGSQLLRQIAATRPLADVVEGEHMPGPAVQSEEQVLEDFRQRSGSVFHASSTCAMGAHAHARRCRRAAQGARHRPAAGGRCLGLSSGHLRQHQRPDRHGGRKGRRDDFARPPLTHPLSTRQRPKLRTP